MTNRDKFKLTFGFDAEKLQHSDDGMFFTWLNDHYNDKNNFKIFHCNKCKTDYVTEVTRKEVDEFGVTTYYSKCLFCGKENEVYYCSWR